MSERDEIQAVLGRVLAHLEAVLPVNGAEIAWEDAVAFRWRKPQLGRGHLQAVRHLSKLRLDDLKCVDRQKAELETNTRQFLRGLPANNALLWGPRGTGKSSLVKAVLNAYADDGLRLIEVEKEHLVDLPDIVEPLYERPERFLVFCDDLSFDDADSRYKALKVVLDGSISVTPENVLVYATSNRRHLLPENMNENLKAHNVGGEIHHSEGVEEKISLSERFGLWLSFHPFSQEEYLQVAHHWLQRLQVADGDAAQVREAALRWALLHGSRSGRSAWQFAKDWAGKRGLETVHGA